MHSTIDRELECNCILATLSIVEEKVVITRRSISHSISVPGKVLTSRDQCICMHFIIDRELECNCILATLGIGEEKVVITRRSISYSISIPCKVLTSRDQCICMHSTIDRELECNCIMATLCIGEEKVVITRRSISYSISIPCKVLPSCDQFTCTHFFISRELECNCILATLSIGEEKVVITRRSISHSISIPGKVLASSDQCISVHSTIDRELEG